MNSPNTHADPQRTTTSPVLLAEAGDSHLVGLTVLWHPDAGRIGAQAILPETGTSVSLNRYAPTFRDPLTGDLHPLAWSGISRSPLNLVVALDGAVAVSRSPSRMSCEINGSEFGESTQLDSTCVDRGVILILGGQVALCLHRITTLPETEPAGALVGVSSAMIRLRRWVRTAAASDLPVLILGETGTGKELIAQAIHRNSKRASHAMHCVNMAAVNESLAAAELFGVVRGAFTGAQATRKGLFPQAHQGTLFLDEVGDTPGTVQPMLLRAIETGEYRAVGGSQSEHCDVRILAATDRDLSVSEFNQPLLRRLEGIVVLTVPLRQRREDIGVLARHMLGSTLSDPNAAGSVPAQLVRALVLYDWPGNVRQLGYAMQRLTLGWSTGQWPTVDELLGIRDQQPDSTPSFYSARAPAPDSEHGKLDSTNAAPASTPAALLPPQRTFRKPASVTAEMLETALDDSGWCLRDAARLLGVSRPSLYNLLTLHGSARSAHTLSARDIESAMSPTPGDLSALASRLRTPREALRRRMRTLGLKSPT